MATFDNTSQTGYGITGALWTGTGPSADFSLTVTPASHTVDAGDTAVYSVQVAAAGGFAGAVSLSISGLAPGVVAVFSPSSVTGSGTSLLTLYTADGSPGGSYLFTVTGTSGGITHTATATLVISLVSLGSIRVLIDGLDRSNFLYYKSSARWNLMRGSRGSAQLPFIIRPGSSFAPQVGQFVEIWDNGNREWAGTIDGVEITWLGDDGFHVITVTGVSLEALLDGVQLDKVQYTSAVTPVTCGDVVSDLWSRASIPIVTLGTISAGPNVESLNVTSVKDALDTLASIAGFIWYVDPRDLKLYFHDPSSRAADWTLIDSPDTSAHGALFESFDYKQTRQDFADAFVFQNPGEAIQTQSQTFPGDGSTTVFTLSQVPQFITSADVSPIGTGAQTPLGSTVTWTPGTNKISVTPAMLVGYELVVKYLDPGQTSVSSTTYGSTIGHRTRRYTRTRAFTSDGVLQEATAALARYRLLPAELVLITDKPGITIGRKFTINVSYPAQSAAVLNGDWQVVEVEAAIQAGLDNLNAPYGHFRYTLHLVNFMALAVFQGDGTTTSFALPEVPVSTGTVQVKNAGGAPFTPVSFGGFCTVTPAPPDGSTVTVPYQSGTNFPSPSTFTQTWEQMVPGTGLPTEPGAGAGSSTGDNTVPATTQGTPQIYIRTLTLRDLTVGNDIASCPPAQHAGVGKRILGIAKKDLTADLTVRFNLNGTDIITVTIPAHYPLENVLEWPLITGSPAIAVPVNDKDVWTADILDSDGQTVTNPQDMVAQFTVEWEYD